MYEITPRHSLEHLCLSTATSQSKIAQAGEFMRRMVSDSTWQANRQAFFEPWIQDPEGTTFRPNTESHHFIAQSTVSYPRQSEPVRTVELSARGIRPVEVDGGALITIRYVAGHAALIEKVELVKVIGKELEATQRAQEVLAATKGHRLWVPFELEPSRKTVASVFSLLNHIKTSRGIKFPL